MMGNNKAAAQIKKSLKIRAVLFIWAICLGLLPMAGEALAEEERALDTIHVVTPEWAGQTNRDGSGLFFEIVRAVYEPAGIHMDFKLVPWKRCQAMLATPRSDADAMLCTWKPHARKRRLLTPAYPLYVEQTAVIFKKASKISWQGIHSLDYRRAVWLRGYNYHTDSQMKSVQLSLQHEVDSYEEAWRQLNLDRFDFYIEALIDLDAYIREKNIDMRLYQKEVLWRTDAYVAFSNTDRSRRLIAVFDREMSQLFQSGRLAQIYRKWKQPFFSEHWEAVSPSKE
ncbi:MAG: transporter substrate-binding domain-containing protein [Desulfobacter sp.]|nr:MAG: transporter substrate-binding domain-containing protein [Desulfobacter sp.]